jgi:hypothetical protein
MNSKSKSGSAGEKSRRAFIHKIGTAAAVSSLAANASAAQQPPPPRRAPETWPEPGPLSKQPMPTIRLGKHQVSRLIIGTNGVGQHFSEVLRRTYNAWNTPEQQMQRYKHAEELGINCMVQARDRIAQYNKEYGGKMLFCNQGSYSRFPTGEVRDPTKEIKEMAALGSIAIHYSAAGADNMWRRGEFNKIREWCKIVRDTGCLVGVNGHLPEAFMQMEDQGWDVDFYETGLYIFGRTQAEFEQLYKSNPDLAPVAVGEPPTEGDSEYYGGQSVWVRGDPAKMLKVIKQVKKPCLVFKLLASGNLMANAQPKLQQQIVEARFKYVFENIKSTDAVVVGMWNKYEDQYALNKEYVIKYGGSSIKVS